MKKFNIKKFRSIVIRMAAMACTFIMAMSNEIVTFAAHNAENGTPTNAKTATYSALVGIVFWVIRVIIIIIGAGPAFIKITQSMISITGTTKISSPSAVTSPISDE